MKFVHVRDDNRVPFATIAFDDTNVAVSICNESDHFSKKMGREVAAGRLLAGNVIANKRIVNGKEVGGYPNRLVECLGPCQVREIIEAYLVTIDEARKLEKTVTVYNAVEKSV